MLPKCLRFRLNWRGRLILQRQEEVALSWPHDPRRRPPMRWVDCSSQNLLDLAKEAQAAHLIVTPDDYRLNVTWNGKVLLQRLATEWDSFGGYPDRVTRWRDAGITDLNHFSSPTFNLESTFP